MSTRPRLGLALPSGAARGAAHAGVILALEEAGVQVDVIAGASAGAIIGGAWAAGVSAGEIAERVTSASWADFASPVPSARLGLLDTRPLIERLLNAFGSRRIEDLPVRFGAVVTGLPDAQPVIVDSGPLAGAIVASSAVPGLFPPARLGERRFVDGGVSSPLPIWAARRLGADMVVAVTLREQPRWRRRLESLPRHPAYRQRADLTISLDTRQASAWSPQDVPRLVELGYQTCLRALDQSPPAVWEPAMPDVVPSGER